ncbi:MAG: hypothetical protein IJ586_07455 [Alloprevotella sp.]|nr:hypothetical protein [Alloprevotella sp.]
MNKEITIVVPDGKRAEWINGVLTLVDEPKVDNRDVTERIKTFTDAMEALGQGNPLVGEYIAVRDKLRTDAGELIAYLKLCIIVAALNEGWEPKFEKGECRYFSWFYLYTKEQYDELDDEEKGLCVLRSGNVAYSSYGYVRCITAYEALGSGAYGCSRLAFRTRELAEYASRQFIEEWVDFMFKPRTGEELNGKLRRRKFKVKDWVVLMVGELSTTLQIVNVDTNKKRYWFNDNSYLPIVDEECLHLWTIQDAKSGDVLVYKDEISLYKHDIKNCNRQKTTFDGFAYYCCYDGKRFITDSLYSLTEQDKIDIHPATKEQRDTLMKTLTDAGYTFDFNKKKLWKKLTINR